MGQQERAVVFLASQGTMREEVAADLTLSLPEEPFESDREAELLFDNEYDRIRRTRDGDFVAVGRETLGRW